MSCTTLPSHHPLRRGRGPPPPPPPGRAPAPPPPHSHPPHPAAPGAGRGPGRAMALALADAGCDIVAAARTRPQIEETAEAVRATGRSCLVVPTDITDPASVQAMVDAAIAEFGRIDVLLNNAGGATAGMGKPVEEITDEEW